MKYHNLIKEMTLKNLTYKDVSQEIKITVKSYYNKINGVTEFTWSDVQAISKKFFPCMDKDYLFERSNNDHIK